VTVTRGRCCRQCRTDRRRECKASAFAQATRRPCRCPRVPPASLTCHHRRRVFTQNRHRPCSGATVTKFAADTAVKLDISTPSRSLWATFLGKVSAAGKAGNPPDLAYTNPSAVPADEPCSIMVEESVRRGRAKRSAVTATSCGHQRGKSRWAGLTANEGPCRVMCQWHGIFAAATG